MRIWDAIIRADMERILALENYLASRQWHRHDPEPRRLERLIAAERALMARHIEAAAEEERLPVQ